LSDSGMRDRARGAKVGTVASEGNSRQLRQD
jgi:hypothetical protein